MNRTKKLLIGLFTVAAMPAFADTKTMTSSSGESPLEALFRADLQYRSESQSVIASLLNVFLRQRQLKNQPK